jgi:phage terminase large subunit-like protein
MTEGTVVDYSVIEAAVLADCRASGVRELAYDKRFAGQLAQNLAAAGVTCVDTPQGFGLNEAIKRTSELIVSGALCHGDNPILTWMAANAVGRFGRNGEVRLDKQAAREKIDGVMALVMAMSRAIVAPPPEPQFQLIVIGNGR